MDPAAVDLEVIDAAVSDWGCQSEVASEFRIVCLHVHRPGANGVEGHRGGAAIVTGRVHLIECQIDDAARLDGSAQTVSAGEDRDIR